MTARCLVTLAAMLVSTPALAIDISTCDQVVPRGQIGVLIADLDCPTTAVRLEMGARLQLDGYMIAVDSGLGVECRQKRCTIEGPGVLDGKSTASTGISGLERVGGDGIDIVSERRPRLIDSTCGRSADKGGTPWGVCTND